MRIIIHTVDEIETQEIMKKLEQHLREKRYKIRKRGGEKEPTQIDIYSRLR